MVLQPVAVKEIRKVKTKRKVPVYDVKMAGENPYYQLSNGVISHNTVPAASELRRCYQPRYKGWLNLHVDVSGAELAVVAAMANETTMLDAIMHKKDLHMITAVRVFQLPPEEIQPMMRRNAKITTFLILFGGTAVALSEQIKCTLHYAQWIINAFYDAYPNLAKWLQTRSQVAIDNGGWVPSIVGCPIMIDLNNASTLGTTPLNYPVQSSSTMINGVSFYRCWKACKEFGIPMIPNSFTHDSLDSEVRSGYQILANRLYQYTCSKVVWDEFNVPFRLDLEMGSNGYEQIHQTILTDLEAGTEANPHQIEIEGTKLGIDQTVDILRHDFDVDVSEIETTKVYTENMSELWIARRSSNVSMITGETITVQKGTIKLAHKSDETRFTPDKSIKRGVPKERVDSIMEWVNDLAKTTMEEHNA